MTQAVHLESSLTFVPPATLKPGSKNLVDADTFADADQHSLIRDADFAQALRDFAMSEGMALATIRVGSKEENTPVEFYYLDVKKNKKEMAKLAKLISRRWLEAIQEAELARDDADGDLLSDDVTDALSSVENIIALRRFIVNGTEPGMLTRKKRTVLLFHHTLENAPRPS